MFQIIKTRDFNVKLKATIHKSGRLGFTSDTARALNLTTQSYAKFAKDDEDNEQLYLVLVDNSDEDTFTFTKSGAYFYLPTTAMFQSFGYDFKKYNFMFDLVRIEDLDAIAGGQVYKLNKRTTMKKTKAS